MSTRRCGRGRDRGRIGIVTPSLVGNDPVDFMAALENMAAAMQVTAEALGNKINQGNHGYNNDEDGPMTLATFLKVHPPTFRRTSIPLMHIIGFRLWKGRYRYNRFLRSNGLNLKLISCKMKFSMGDRGHDVSCRQVTL